MKKSILLGLGVCALALGGVAALVEQKGAVETKAEGVGYYLVGDGSFSSSPWDNAGGIQLQANAGNNGALFTQYLAKDDVFKVVNTARDYWYGYGSYKSGGTAFGKTSYSRSDKSRAEMGFSTTACSWWKDADSTTVVTLTGGAVGHEYNADTGKNVGSIDGIYTDNTTVRFSRSAHAPNYAEVSLPTDWSAKNTFVLNSTGNGGEWQWWDEYGTNIVVKESGYYNIYFNTFCEIYIYDAIGTWIADYMHMSDANYDGEGTGLCKSAGTYDAAKAALISLGSGAIDFFRANSQGKYTDALARYNNWAAANQDANPFSLGGGANVVLGEYQTSTANSVIIISTVVGMIAFVGAGSMYLAHKRKAE